MIDWNGNGKIDGTDWAITSSLMEEGKGGGRAPSGCCGPGMALLLLALSLVGAVIHMISKAV